MHREAYTRLKNRSCFHKKHGRIVVMGTIILAIAFVLEAALVAYCILTKSGQSKVKSFIRIGALAGFVLFTLAAVIQWSFR